MYLDKMASLCRRGNGYHLAKAWGGVWILVVSVCVCVCLKAVTLIKLWFKPTHTYCQSLEDSLRLVSEGSPPPSSSVGSRHPRTYCRHLPTPTGVMLKEHMGSPAMVSAPSCITMASGLKCAYTSCITLRKTQKGACL